MYSKCKVITADICYLVRRQTLNHLAKLAKWLSCVVSNYLYGPFDCVLLSIRTSYSIRVHDMITTHDEHSSIIWPVWLNGWVFVNELSGWVRLPLQSLKIQISRLFRARCSSHSGNYRETPQTFTTRPHKLNKYKRESIKECSKQNLGTALKNLRWRDHINSVFLKGSLLQS